MNKFMNDGIGGIDNRVFKELVVVVKICGF